MSCLNFFFFFFSISGRSLSVLSTSQLLCNPDIKEAHFLRGWYDREGSALDFSTFQSDGSAGGGGKFQNYFY